MTSSALIFNGLTTSKKKIKFFFPAAYFVSMYRTQL